MKGLAARSWIPSQLLVESVQLIYKQRTNMIRRRERLRFDRISSDVK
jgi:hypothetical protein